MQSANVRAPPRSIAPTAIPIPAPAAGLRPFDPEPEELLGVVSGRALVSLGLRGLSQGHRQHKFRNQQLKEWDIPINYL